MLSTKIDVKLNDDGNDNKQLLLFDYEVMKKEEGLSEEDEIES